MIATILCSLAGGMMVALAAAPVQLIAPRFIRLSGIIALGAATTIVVWSVMDNSAVASTRWWIAIATTAACSVFAGCIVWLASSVDSNAKQIRWIGVVGGACGVSAACFWATMTAATPAQSSAMAVLNTVSQIIGAVLLGSVTVAWLLGHAYLTATKMTIAPLRFLTRLFSIAVIARFAFLVVCVLLIRFVPNLAQPAGTWSALAGSWLILSLRLLVGLLALGVFAYMAGDCVKLRSTQSATGILYFASVFAYIGELSSQHLVSEWGLPL